MGTRGIGSSLLRTSNATESDIRRKLASVGIHFKHAAVAVVRIISGHAARSPVTPAGGGERIFAVGFMMAENWLEPLHSGYISDYRDRRSVPPWDR